MRLWRNFELPPARHKLPPVMQMRLALAEAELALGKAGTAAEQLAGLLASQAQERATRTWLYREAQEWAAVARLRRGDPAADVLRSLKAFDSSLPEDGPQPPGEAATIDSTLRRTELLLAAGRKGEALEALAAVAMLINNQHADSPRRAG